MSRKYYSILAVIIAIMILQVGVLSANALHYNVTMRPDWLPSPDPRDTMLIQGILTVDQQVRTGDEIGVFYNGKLCGAQLVENNDASFAVCIFDSTAVYYGPVPGGVLELRLWDSKNSVEVTSGLQITITDAAVKNAFGKLIWKLSSFDNPWRVDISYNSLVGVTQVVPNEKYADRTSEITITGYNFAAGAKVKIGSIELTQVNFVNATTLQATVPAGILSVGTYNVTVTVGVKSASLPGGLKILSPPLSVSLVEPNVNYTDQTLGITITGSGFAAGAKVKIGSFELTPVSFLDATTLKATVPAQLFTTGTYDLTVIVGEAVTTLPNGFKVLPSATPRINMLNPIKGTNDQPTFLWIIGSNLFSGSQVKLGSLRLNVTSYSGDVLIIAEIPAGIAAGTYTLTVTTQAGLEGSLANGFTVESPPVAVNRVEPNKSYSNQSQEITVYGNNFAAGAKVKIGSSELSQVSFINTTTLKATVPAGLFSVGAYDLVVVAAGTNGTLTGGFTILQGHEEKVGLVRGLNLLCYPVSVPSSYFSYNFLTQYFTPQSLEGLWHYNNQNDKWEVTSFDNQGLPSGDRFLIQNGDGYLVYSKMKKDLVFPGMGAPFETNLYQGINVVSFSLPNESYSSYDLLKGLLDEQAEIAALQRFEKNSGRWYVTFSLSGKPAGDNFPISKDESYVVYMKKDKLAWIPN